MICAHGCPSFWGCATRGPYADAVARYADQHQRSYPQRYQDERSPDGRSIYLDHCGEYTRGKHEAPNEGGK